MDYSLVKGQKFQWRTIEGGYIVPGQTLHEGVYKDSLVLNTTSEEGFWTWTTEGQVRWSEGWEGQQHTSNIDKIPKGCRKCVTSLKSNQPVTITFCEDLAEDQNVEIGRFGEGEGGRVLRPLGMFLLK